MNISRSDELNHDITLFLSGRIDTDTSSQLRAAMNELPDEIRTLILDFRDVPYISSAGLRELLIARKKYPEEHLKLVNVNQDVMEIFETVGFDTILPIAEEHEDLSTFIKISFKELLSQHVSHAADQTILKNAQETYTWKDVEIASQIIAEDLNRLGITPGKRVGLCGLNSINWILTFFAIQKLGAVAVLMNPGLSLSELAMISDTANLSAFCYGELSAVNDVQELSRVHSVVYSFRNEIAFKSRFHEYSVISGQFSETYDYDAPSVIIFTSGSTGRPKGVIFSAYNLLNASAVQVRMQKMTETDKELLIVPLFHILGLIVCFLPSLMSDVTLYIPADTHSLTIINAMKEEQCTLMHSVPTLIMAILNNPNCVTTAFSSLRCSYLAGAATTQVQMKLFWTRMPNTHFMIAYGLSEMAPVTVTNYDDTEDHLLQTVGTPVENIELRIVDPDTGTICSIGEQGEIQVQGYNLMTGYYKMPIEDQSIDSEGWLHTGDIGSLDKDNYLTLHGRYKDLIIRGGENIMPREVEEAIAAINEIEDVRVFGVPSDFYGEEVAAAIIISNKNLWKEEEARKILSTKLAKYKIPRWFVLYDSFPHLGSGKIDSVALRTDILKRLNLDNKG
ncbi:MAG: AMP-binding protein [Solobacterium sp.]|nr:AMP-binding protein [Solobacterium sp.]